MTDQAWMDEIAAKVKHARDLYYRLVLTVKSPSAEDLGVGRTIATELKLSRISGGVELGERLFDLPARQRPLRVGRVLHDVVTEYPGDVILLDDLEILFDVSLKQDPLRLLQGLSRTRTVVAVWSGRLDDGNLVYAVPGHPEYRSYPATDLLIVHTAGSR